MAASRYQKPASLSLDDAISPSKTSARKRQFSVYKFASKKPAPSPLVISSSYTQNKMPYQAIPSPKVAFVSSGAKGHLFPLARHRIQN
ncbi:hypothetical protein AVEN_177038-1 [Araneus ventricosus]|uniref:Uncharacterized protein n=1 Tax=Araneus ventricosus TaxID=182803 RepID=A0A4Y2CRQ9_ARAVE|nr:hypothetical protein AVEN_177038-1 [Araneus ventricosus]